MNLTKEQKDQLAAEIAPDLASDNPNTRKVAQNRLDTLRGKDPQVQVFSEEFAFSIEDFKQRLADLENNQAPSEQKSNPAIVSPAEILKNRYVYASENFPEIDTNEQLQQVGIDLRLAKASKVTGTATLTVNKANIVKPQINEMQVTDGFLLFKAGELYSLDFMEDVTIPENMAAIIKHRSTINRTIGTIESGWFDPGFSSSGGCGAVFRPNTDVKIQIGFRCAQIVFYTATSANLYNGQYQGT